MFRAAASERNKGPILNVLKGLIPKETIFNALEIASGYGVHVSHFADYFRNGVWQPSDVENESFASIMACRGEYGVENVKDPILIDVATPIDQWPNEGKSLEGNLDLLLCINMIHISEFEATIGLFKAARKLLKPTTGILVTYGPYSQNGFISPQSNLLFHQSLQMKNPNWGLKDLKEIEDLGVQNGLTLNSVIPMPANNFTLIFKRNP